MSDRSVVANLSPRRSARMVGVEGHVPSFDLESAVERTVASRQTPDALAVVVELRWIVDGVSTLSQGGSAGILEIVDALVAHVGIANSAKIDPDVRVLMSEQRGKIHVFVVIELSPLVAFSELSPCLRSDWMRR